jgi:hypothetical protein
MVGNQKQQQFNPLSAYFRQPKIYVKLPSGGQFYPPGALDVSANGEYPVYSMTAKDELIFKTPDALMNGQATVELVKSCFPAIKNPWAMPSMDIDAILISIRIATYGEDMDFQSNCPACQEENTYTLNLINYIEQVQNFQYNANVVIDDLEITLRPYNYKEVTGQSIKALEQQKIFAVINDEKLSDQEKLDRFGESFVKLTEMTVDIVAGCISSIKTPQAEVTDQNMIQEFINNAPKEIFNQIVEHVEKMKSDIDLKAQDVECGSCKTPYKITLNIDQSNFFAVRS